MQLDANITQKSHVMTSEERKQGLRRAVDAKIQRLAVEKEQALLTLNVDQFGADWIARGWRIDLLWEVVDSLVDEVTPPADPLSQESLMLLMDTLNRKGNSCTTYEHLMATALTHVFRERRA